MPDHEKGTDEESVDKLALALHNPVIWMFGVPLAFCVLFCAYRFCNEMSKSCKIILGNCFEEVRSGTVRVHSEKALVDDLEDAKRIVDNKPDTVRQKLLEDQSHLYAAPYSPPPSEEPFLADQALSTQRETSAATVEARRAGQGEDKRKPPSTKGDGLV
jgi:hypothetical protein